MEAHKGPYALLVKKNTFEPYKMPPQVDIDFECTREEVLGIVCDHFGETPTVTTTGFTSREMFELREARGEGHGKDFLTVGSMGHCSSIALGMSLARDEASPAGGKVLCIDGDGGCIMHFGAMVTIGQQASVVRTRVRFCFAVVARRLPRARAAAFDVAVPALPPRFCLAAVARRLPRPRATAVDVAVPADVWRDTQPRGALRSTPPPLPQGGANLKHLLINNGMHDSVGGQPSKGFNVDMVGVAKACGYKSYKSVDSRADIEAAVKELHEASDGPAFLEVRVRGGSRADLGRPTTSPVQNKEAFMKNNGAQP
jgi:thiamine pyrophosphate-dependent acetolactate synthase large subunit-like protein